MTGTRYFNWDDYAADTSFAEDVLSSFRVPNREREAEHIELIAAHYTYEDYSGYAFVVYRDKRDGRVYEVNGGHCSCYGLEGQWEPEEVVVAELLKRPIYVYDGRENENIRAALREALG
jgi:hypothetical protein